jgi:hypothetical protein
LQTLKPSRRVFRSYSASILNWGGKLLGFNIDPDFSDVLDGLMWVDLMEADPKVLERFMGKEGVRSFRDFHKQQE